MATSGSVNYTQNAYSVILDVLNTLGMTTAGAVPNTDTVEKVRRALNRTLKRWQATGVMIHTQAEGALIFTPDTAQYTMPNTALTGNSVGVIKASVLNTTTIDTAATVSDTTISVLSSAGMTVGDTVILQLDDGTRQVTTINAIPDATSITLTAALDDDMSSGNIVYAYPSAVSNDNLFYPIKLSNVRIRDKDGNERPIIEYTRTEYYTLPNKESSGTPNIYYIDDQLTNKTISVFPVPDDISYSLRYTYAKRIDDIDSLTDDIELPTELLDCIIYNVAVMVAPQLYKAAKVREDGIDVMAQILYTEMLQYCREAKDIQLCPYTGDDY